MKPDQKSKLVGGFGTFGFFNVISLSLKNKNNYFTPKKLSMKLIICVKTSICSDCSAITASCSAFFVACSSICDCIAAIASSLVTGCSRPVISIVGSIVGSTVDSVVGIVVTIVVGIVVGTVVGIVVATVVATVVNGISIGLIDTSSPLTTTVVVYS